MTEIEKAKCVVRMGTLEEMKNVWGYCNRELSSTAQFFVDSISKGRAVFYALDYQGKVIGELYVFYELDDKDFANAEEKAYFCAFRISREYQHQGLGTYMITSVMQELKGHGIKRVTIGVDKTEEDNIRLYWRLGFNEKIKDCFSDPCDVDSDMNPQKCECFWLLQKEL